MILIEIQFSYFTSAELCHKCCQKIRNNQYAEWSYQWYKEVAVHPVLYRLEHCCSQAYCFAWQSELQRSIYVHLVGLMPRLAAWRGHFHKLLHLFKERTASIY